MMDRTKMQTDYQRTMISRSNYRIPRRRHPRLHSLLILGSLICAFLFVTGWAVSGLQNGFYASHITGWHRVTVVQGETVYGFASASGAGYIPAVEQAIDERNKLVDGQIYAGMVLWIPTGGNKRWH
jgi:hypothetical protein